MTTIKGMKEEIVKVKLIKSFFKHATRKKIVKLLRLFELKESEIKRILPKEDK